VSQPGAKRAKTEVASDSPSVTQATQAAKGFVSRLLRIPIAIAAAGLRPLGLARVRKSTWLKICGTLFAIGLLGILLVQRSRDPQSKSKLDWWNAPIEINHWLSLPGFENASLNAVAVLPSGRVLVGGNNGLLAYSDDHGQKWVPVLFDPKNETFSSIAQGASEQVSGDQGTGANPKPPPSSNSQNQSRAGEGNLKSTGRAQANQVGSQSGKVESAPQTNAINPAPAKKRASPPAEPAAKKTPREKKEAGLLDFELLPRVYAAELGPQQSAQQPSSQQQYPQQQNPRQQGPSQGGPQLPNAEPQGPRQEGSQAGRQGQNNQQQSPAQGQQPNPQLEKANPGAQQIPGVLNQQQGTPQRRPAPASPSTNIKAGVNESAGRAKKRSSANPAPASLSARRVYVPVAEQTQPDVLVLDNYDDKVLALYSRDGRSWFSVDSGLNWRMSSEGVPAAGGWIAWMRTGGPLGEAFSAQRFGEALARYSYRPPGAEHRLRYLPEESEITSGYVSSGRRAWSTGCDQANGRISVSDDQGRSWKLLATSPVCLRDLVMSGDGATGYAVGDNGAIFYSVTNGNGWQAITRGALGEKNQTGWFDHYWKLPAPWIQIVLFFSLACLGMAVLISAPEADTLEEAGLKVTGKDEPGKSAPQVANFTVSDRPLEPDDFDAMGFGHVARGISGFLRNPRTLLPITIAINGAWGLGKSSMMNLIYRDLDLHGFRPMAFNAWHHQEDDNLLASLLQSVKEDAVPSFFSFAGGMFRVRLAWQRLVRFYPRALGMLAVLVLLVGVQYSYYHSAKSGGLPYLPQAVQLINGRLEALKNSLDPTHKSTSEPKSGQASEGSEKAQGSTQPAPDAGGLLALLMGMLVQGFSLIDKVVRPSEYGAAQPLATLYVLFRIFPSALKRLQAFSENPATLLRSSSPGASEKQLEAQSSFRMRFAREFSDVTKALGSRRRLVIFIDDLDRCRPAKVAEMLEAVNYIVVSGQCAVIMGLETNAVKAAVGLSFRDMAEEFEQPGGVTDLLNAGEQKRRRFAEQYIEKLINIEINVPNPSEEQKDKLLEQARENAQRDTERARERHVVAGLAFMKSLARLALVLGIAWGLGVMLLNMVEWRARVYFENQAATKLARYPASGQQQEKQTNPTGAAATGPSAAENAAPVQAASPAPRPSRVPTLHEGESPFPGQLLRGWKAWVCLGALALLFISLLSRVPQAQTSDSGEFTRALGQWAPVAGAKLKTPRSVKRFLNRVRCLAMLQHPPEPKQSVLVRWLAPRPDSTPAQVAAPIPEQYLVALSAIEAYDPALIEDDIRLEDFLSSPRLGALFGPINPMEIAEKREGLLAWLHQYKTLRSGGLLSA